jgi:hypothetical protein
MLGGLVCGALQVVGFNNRRIVDEEHFLWHSVWLMHHCSVCPPQPQERWGVLRLAGQWYVLLANHTNTEHTLMKHPSKMFVQCITVSIVVLLATQFACGKALFLAHYDQTTDADLAVGATVARPVKGYERAGIVAAGHWAVPRNVFAADPTILCGLSRIVHGCGLLPGRGQLHWCLCDSRLRQ